ncbi:MAG: HEPN domain-containing protein [Deltaproteobacteria bacterium]|nr:HEPN domain-containing protein [Deltaproteobacteria bacterium]
MKNRASLLPKDWFHKGDIDIRRAEILLENNDAGGAAFHLQQAIEKSLKGYLIGKGWKLERIHDLEGLLDYAVDYNVGFEEFRVLCQEATEYYIEERYPFLMSSELTEDEVLLRIKKAKEFISKLREEV